MTHLINCAGGCGKEVEKPEYEGWIYLEITGRYRCGDCQKQLKAIGKESELKIPLVVNPMSEWPFKVSEGI